jgi:ABC-type transporter MlaC component
MKTQKFMNVEIEAIKKIIKSKLPTHFDSHDFIQVFSKEFESAYIELLNKYKNKSIRTTHAQIAINLRKSMNDLKIIKSDDTKSKSIFGNNVANKKWTKVD